MKTCYVVANTTDELRQLVEIKAAELIARGHKVVKSKGQRVIQKDLFNIAIRQNFQAILVWE